MERILVPTDFSEASENAAGFAADLARRTGADLYLLHVMEVPTHSTNYTFEEYQEVPEGIALMKAAKERFQQFKDKPIFKDVNVIEAVQFERTYENIVQQAKNHEIDLIVMGSHGATGMREMFVGSNTERVVRMAHCPVLTVKQKLAPDQINDMVFASDFNSEIYGNFPRIKKLAELFDARIHLLKVVTPNQFEASSKSHREMQALAEEFQLKDHTANVYNDEYVEAGILHFADSIDADLISLSTHGRRGLVHLINGSLAEDVANHAERPVLSIRIQEE
ncbi:MAG: universal stress protein [Flavobacteriales bacterium]